MADACRTGAATDIIFGLALGYKSTIIPCLCIATAIYVSFTLASMYGIAIAALGMLTTLSTGELFGRGGSMRVRGGAGRCARPATHPRTHQTHHPLPIPYPPGLAIDAYGPISDNAGGIAEMAAMGDDIRERTDALDAAGNTTAAIGKGFAIGSAALVSLALFGAYVTRAGVRAVDSSILDPQIFAGLLVGAMLPYWFSAMTMKSVGKAALAMVEEVRRQFNTIPGLMEGTARPDYRQCVEISTQASLSEMIPPGCLVMLTPVVVGVLFGTRALAGVLAGALVSGVQMAISMSNTGGECGGLGWLGRRVVGRGNAGGGRPRAGGGRDQLPLCPSSPAACRHPTPHAPQHPHPHPLRRVGQRQEVRRGRRLRARRLPGRQGLRRSQGGRHRRHRRRPAQGHVGPVAQHPDQAHGGRVPGVCPLLPGPHAERHLRPPVRVMG